MTPKVSICIPAYQQPTLLRRALKSIFTQSFSNYEVIITDDSSDTSIEAIVKEIQPESRLKYFRNSERKGSPENWNESIRHAQGEYIKILHHDDWLKHKDSLFKFVKMLDENPYADFAFCSSAACSQDEKILFYHIPTKNQLRHLRKNADYLFPDNFIGAPSATIFRKKIDTTFDPKLKWVVDIDFYIRLLRKNKKFAFCQEPLICVTTGSTNQVTASCVSDRNIQLFEWLYLFIKMHKTRTPHFRQIIFIWRLLIKYRVTSIREIENMGLLPPYPHILFILLFLTRIGPFA